MIKGDRGIDANEVPVMARYLDWTLEEYYLASMGNGAALTSLPSNLIKVPVICWVHAGSWADITTEYKPGESETEGEIDVPFDGRRTLIAFRVKGTSINRVAPEGSIILVDYADKEPVKERFYVVQKAGEASCKRYLPAPARFEPYSTDPHETIYPDADTQIVGRVLKVLTDL